MKKLITPLFAFTMILSSCGDNKKEKKDDKPLSSGPIVQHPIATPGGQESLPPLPEPVVTDTTNPFAGLPLVSFYAYNQALGLRQIPLITEIGANLGITTNNSWDVVRYVRPINKQMVQSYSMISDDPVIRSLTGGQRVCLPGVDSTGRRIERREVAASPSHTDELRAYCEYTETAQDFKVNEGQQLAVNHVELISKDPNRYKFVSIAAFQGMPDFATTSNVFADRCGIHTEVVPVAQPQHTLPNNALNMGRPAFIQQHQVGELANGSRHMYMPPTSVKSCRVVRNIPTINQFGAETLLQRAMWIAQYDLIPNGDVSHTIRVTFEIEADSVQQSQGFLIDELVLNMWELLPRAR